MKKFLAVLFAVIFALSSMTVAFAAATYECEDCYVVFQDKTTYEKHINGGCEVAFVTCQYCEQRVDKDYEAGHLDNCAAANKICDVCGTAIKTHEDGKACVTTEDQIKDVADKVIDTVKKVDWDKVINTVKPVFNKVIDAVKGIDFEGLIAKIKPLLEKVVALFDGATA